MNLVAIVAGAMTTITTPLPCTWKKWWGPASQLPMRWMAIR